MTATLTIDIATRATTTTVSMPGVEIGVPGPQGPPGSGGGGGGSTDPATTTAAGIVELATNAETVTGTDTVRATTPAGVKAALDGRVAAATETVAGISEHATQGETNTGTLDTVTVTPLKLKTLLDASTAPLVHSHIATQLPASVPHDVWQAVGGTWPARPAVPAGARCNGISQPGLTDAPPWMTSIDSYTMRTT